MRRIRLKTIGSYVILLLGVTILTTFIAFSLFPSAIAPYSPKLSFESFLGCSSDHILGTNNLGYDVFSELVYATGSTLSIGLLSALIALVIGVVVGLLSGYFGGIAGETLNGIINFFLLIPMLPLAIVLAAYFGAGQFNLVVTIALLGWCGTARAVRAKTLHLRHSTYVASMRGLGYSHCRILFCHILPNVMDVALAKYISAVASCVLLEATLGFLGLGDVTNVTWGLMINFAYKFGGLARGAYNWLLAPGVSIILLVLAFYFINFFFEYRLRVVKGMKITD